MGGLCDVMVERSFSVASSNLGRSASRYITALGKQLTSSRAAAGKVTAGLVESTCNGSLPPGGWLKVTAG